MIKAVGDEIWMRQALRLAKKAASLGEIPVGAVLIYSGMNSKPDTNHIISSTYNQPITLCDPTAHAEILAIRQAGQYFQNYRLLNTTLYVTLEPCPMCLGAIEHARIPRVVFGAFDTRRAHSTPHLSATRKIPNLDLFGGVLEQECKEVLQNFFKARR